MATTPVSVDVEYFYQKGAKNPRKRGKTAAQVNATLSQVPRGTITGVPYQVGFTMPVRPTHCYMIYLFMARVQLQNSVEPKYSCKGDVLALSESSAGCRHLLVPCQDGMVQLGFSRLPDLLGDLPMLN